MEEELNPYAAPKAEAPAAATHKGTPRRPRSVKWATFVLGSMTVMLIVLYWQAVSDLGAKAVWGEHPIFDFVWLIPISFLLCLFRRRGKVSFFIVAFVLGWMPVRAMTQLLPKWSQPHAALVVPPEERVGALLFLCGLVYLFYRFAFGLPSRTYFGMVPQKEDRQN